MIAICPNLGVHAAECPDLGAVFPKRVNFVRVACTAEQVAQDPDTSGFLVSNARLFDSSITPVGDSDQNIAFFTYEALHLFQNAVA